MNRWFENRFLEWRDQYFPESRGVQPLAVGLSDAKADSELSGSSSR